MANRLALRAGRSLGVVAVLMPVVLLLPVTPAPPAAADHGGVHCMWGKAYEAKYRYTFADGMSPLVAASHRRKVDTLNHSMGGRLVVRESAPTEGAEVLVIEIGGLGQNGYPAQWSGGECEQDPSGHWFFTPFDKSIEYNKWYTDRHSGVVRDPHYPADPTLLDHVSLHELDHSAGGWHQPLHDGGDTPSRCNALYASTDPFRPGEECYALAGTNKQGDIGHLWSRYPGKAPTQHVQCTNQFCDMFLKGW